VTVDTAGSQQSEIFRAMARPEFYPHPVDRIEERETHISKVFLTGDYVYKFKKPLNLEFLDYTTLEKRKHYCHQEVLLNRRLTDDVYLDVIPITLKDGSYSMGGPGKPVEYCVKMRQLPRNTCMVNLLQIEKIGQGEIEMLAGTLARFYGKALTSREITPFGSWETIRTNCEENFTQTEPFAGNVLDERIFEIIRAATRSFLIRRREIFGHRQVTEKVRDCHGDLRSGHIYFYNGIQIVDCIEFNERFRYGDITSDVAFLAMDLDYEGFPEIARSLLKMFVDHTEDPDLFILLDFYKCYRAFVRVKVNCFRLQQEDVTEKNKKTLVQELREYQNLAYRYAVQFTRPTLWVMCGLPASGKSTIAKELGKSLQIPVFRSDVIRKELFGVPAGENLDLPFEEGIYSKQATSLTYGRLLLLAQEEMEKGHSVVLDATYGSRHQRGEVLRLAQDMDANLVFVECTSPEALLKDRLIQREQTFSISDARLQHFDEIKAYFEPLDEVPDEMYMRIETSRSPEKTMQEVLAQDATLLSRQTEMAFE
jgi:hypothetical protein